MNYTFYKIALSLIIIGSLNWGLVGLFKFNLVTALFGVDTLITQGVYILVGLSSIYVTLIQLNILNNTNPTVKL